MEIKNGYSDGSGKGTITLNDNAILRVHWGCSCCDYFDEDILDSKEMKLAIKIVEILNKHKKELESFQEEKKQ